MMTVNRNGKYCDSDNDSEDNVDSNDDSGDGDKNYNSDITSLRNNELSP